MSPAKTIQKGWKHMQAQNICDIQVSDIVGSKDHDERRFRCSRKTRRMIEAVFPQSLVVEDRCFGGRIYPLVI
jgi:hypothetical protein